MSTSKPAPDMTRPKVAVRVPNMVLRIAELAYLRSLANSKPEVQCHPGSNTLSKLRFLDLIAVALKQPSEQVFDKCNKERDKLLSLLKTAIAEHNWETVTNLGYSLSRNERLLEPVKADVLTDKGKALLATGEVTVRVRKTGCI